MTFGRARKVCQNLYILCDLTRPKTTYCTRDSKIVVLICLGGFDICFFDTSMIYTHVSFGTQNVGNDVLDTT